MDLSTDRLMQMIETSPKLFERQELERLTNKTFHDYLAGLMEEHRCAAPQLAVKTGLSKTFVYQILSGTRQPGRDTILKIALSLSLSIDETQRLLTLGGKSILYPKLRRDAAILCCIKQRRGLDEASQILDELGEGDLF